jgi:aminopeptidase YwaD
MKKITLLFLVELLFTTFSYSQLTPFHHWTLLPKNQMDEIIGEASGETALHHVIEMVGYQRNRPFR